MLYYTRLVSLFKKEHMNQVLGLDSGTENEKEVEVGLFSLEKPYSI